MISVLRTKKRRSDHKLVGAYLPSQIYDYLTLYSLSNGVTKTDVINAALTSWRAQRKSNDNVDTLLENISDRAHTQWKIQKATKNPMSFQEFKTAIFKELTAKGISEDRIKTIMQKIKQ